MNQEKIGRIDEQWRSAQPAQWGKGKHVAERRLLQHTLRTDEGILAMSDCTFLEPAGLFGRGPKIWGYHSDRGVALATDQRVLFLKHKVVGGDIAVELPYKSLTGVAATGGGDLAEGVHIVREKDESWRIAQVSPESSQETFARTVTEHADLAEPKGKK